MGGARPMGAASGPMGGGPMGGPMSGSMGQMGCGPLGGGPMGAAAPSGGNMMNFGSAAAKPPNAFDSLDPLAMMAAGKPKKAGGAIAAKKSNDDWGDNPW
mmetsp:Transcript_26557/g.89551  ORF Transcript_26557/g.89551 Transcript_26557/m.89551 type:complete len:100 (+) Transcript_26557:31-330(+)